MPFRYVPNGTKLRINSSLANGLRKGKLRCLKRYDDDWITQFRSVSGGLLQSPVVTMSIFIIGHTVEIDGKLKMGLDLRLA